MKSRPKLKDLGEIALLRRIAGLPFSQGIGDDTAVLDWPRDKQLLITSDILVGGVHFRWPEKNSYRLGIKAVAASVSDIAAMGGRPIWFMVDLGLPADLASSWVSDLYRGFGSAARFFRIKLIGGDTASSPTPFISIISLGEIKKGRALKRSGAKPEDLIFVTGRLGGSATQKYALTSPSPEKIRLKEGQFLAKHQLATSLVDISDGLARSLLDLAQESGVSVEIQARQIPLAKGAGIDQALNGGEDYELVFTCRPEQAKKLSKIWPKNLAPIISIGRITARKGKTSQIWLVTAERKKHCLKIFGYEHFKTN